MGFSGPLDVGLAELEVSAEEVPLEPSGVHHVVVVVGDAAALTGEDAEVVAEVAGRSFEEAPAQADADLPVDGEDPVDDRPLDELLAAGGIHAFTVVVDLPLTDA